MLQILPYSSVPNRNILPITKRISSKSYLILRCLIGTTSTAVAGAEIKSYLILRCLIGTSATTRRISWAQILPYSSVPNRNCMAALPATWLVKSYLILRCLIGTKHHHPRLIFLKSYLILRCLIGTQYRLRCAGSRKSYLILRCLIGTHANSINFNLLKSYLILRCLIGTRQFLPNLQVRFLFFSKNYLYFNKRAAQSQGVVF